MKQWKLQIKFDMNIQLIMEAEQTSMSPCVVSPISSGINVHLTVKHSLKASLQKKPK